MSDVYEVQPVSEPVRGSIRPPGSKSLTNRALITAALADGTSTLTGVLESEAVKLLRRVDLEIKTLAKEGDKALRRPVNMDLVQQLLELFVRHELFVAVQDCNVEVGIGVSAVRAGLQEGLDFMFCRAPRLRT